MTARVRSLTKEDAAEIREIYNWYVVNTVISFEEEPVSLSAMEARVSEGLREFPWMGAEVDGRLVAFAYATQWRPRSAYRFSAESTVYVRRDHTRRGVGLDLYRKLIEEIRTRGFRSVVGTIALPNEASVALHEKLGFRKGGQLECIGRKLGRWVDVGYWYLLFDEDPISDQ
jgi:L-amino acid N-acyltransferase YncA